MEENAKKQNCIVVLHVLTPSYLNNHLFFILSATLCEILVLSKACFSQETAV